MPSGLRPSTPDSPVSRRVLPFICEKSSIQAELVDEETVITGVLKK
jgi:hypothetical protein